MVQLAVVIPTRNRGAQAAEAAAAVLRDPGDFQLVVVDQSTDDATAAALGALPADPRLKVVRSTLRGISNARNMGVAATPAPFVAFTDDDCRPEPGWASTMLRVFQDHPEAAMVFGRVRLPDRQNGSDYAASFEPGVRVLRGRVPLPDVDLGVGANFGVRREVLEALGGFDPLLGTGAPCFRGGEETDLLIRALHAGHVIVNAVECDVLHLGLRTGDEVRRLAVGYQISTGAAFGKYARLTGLPGLVDLVRWSAFYAGKVLADAARLRRPRPGVLAYFVVGAALTFRYGIDRGRRLLVSRAAAPAGAGVQPGRGT
jgi:glycosyltransferase involved in cell wall biosynthesis